MTQNLLKKHQYFIGNILLVLCFIAFSATLVIARIRTHYNSYSFFAEFTDVQGIRKGTPVRLRGFQIGSVVGLTYEIDTIIAHLRVNSRSILIPSESLVESSQVGLLNDVVVDIYPIGDINYTKLNFLDPKDEDCYEFGIICHQSTCCLGENGLNYDDLVRATTRIAQRFDNPKLFQLLYLFFYNTLELSDSAVDISEDMADILISLCEIITKHM